MVAYTDPRFLNERGWSDWTLPPEMVERLSGIVAEVRGARFIVGATARPTKGFFEGTKPMCSMVQVGLNYRFGLQPTEDAAQNGDDLRRDPLEVRKTTRARRSYFRDVATGAFIFR
jgi:hypothetical protein